MFCKNFGGLKNLIFCLLRNIFLSYGNLFLVRKMKTEIEITIYTQYVQLELYSICALYVQYPYVFIFSPECKTFSKNNIFLKQVL